MIELGRLFEPGKGGLLDTVGDGGLGGFNLTVKFFIAFLRLADWRDVLLGERGVLGDEGAFAEVHEAIDELLLAFLEHFDSFLKFGVCLVELKHLLCLGVFHVSCVDLTIGEMRLLKSDDLVSHLNFLVLKLSEAFSKFFVLGKEN